MGLLTRVLDTKPQASYSDSHDFWYTDVGTISKAGTVVSHETAMKVSAVYACVKVLAETVASLPLFIYRRRPDGGKDRDVSHPLHQRLHYLPNKWQTTYEWREMMMGHVLLRGNAYSEKVRGMDGPTTQLIPKNPDRITVEQVPGGKLRYTETEANGTKRIIPANKMFHLRGLSSDGLVGLSPIGLMRESVGVAIATESYASRFFSQNAQPRGALETDATMSEEAEKRLISGWKSAYGGLDQSHGTAVLQQGLKWHQISITNEDSQFLETRKFQVNDIARWFRIPPHMIADLEKATYSNIEHQSLDFVVHSLMPWLRRWETAIHRDLIEQDKEEYFAEFIVEGLLRGDAKARSEFYASGITNGWINRNEVRAKENMNPEEGLDDFLVPMNMGAAGEEAAEQTSPAQAALIVEDAAARLVRKEISEISKRTDRFEENPEGLLNSVGKFYNKHAQQISETLHLPRDIAESFCEKRKAEFVLKGIEMFDKWEADRGYELAALVLGGNAS
jgi:HK97 family phage portal protein